MHRKRCDTAIPNDGMVMNVCLFATFAMIMFAFFQLNKEKEKNSESIF